MNGFTSWYGASRSFREDPSHNENYFKAIVENTDPAFVSNSYVLKT